jgi:thioredoxin reductase (NADPH)
VQGVFIYRENIPAGHPSAWPGSQRKHIRVDRELKTNIPGVFAAGDCTGKPYQLAKAVGEGQAAALNAVNYVDSTPVKN